jgi:hypothetical protein
MAVTRGFGIVGTGVIAAIHADAIAMLSQTGMADARLVAVTDMAPGAATAFAAARGCPAEASLDALLAGRALWRLQRPGGLCSGRFGVEISTERSVDLLAVTSFVLPRALAVGGLRRLQSGPTGGGWPGRPRRTTCRR